MKNSLMVLLVGMFSVSAWALPGMPKKFEVLSSIGGPVQLGVLDSVDLKDVKDEEECSNLKAYVGKAQFKLGTQVYQVKGIETHPQKMCLTDTDYQKFDRFMLILENTDVGFANRIRIVMSKEDPSKAMIAGVPTGSYFAKILE